MAVVKIFPFKDATILSDFNTLNSGISEILDVSKNVSLNFPSFSGVGRILMKFSNDDINNAINNYVGSNPFSASIRLYNANAGAIPIDFNLELHPISESWDVGTGRLDDIPIVTNGVSWTNRKVNIPWITSSFTNGTTGSYFSGSNGGGVWYTGSTVTQSFNFHSPKDIYFDVTSIVTQYVSGSLVNEGFIIKNDSSIEFNSSYQYTLNYFSIETNTIYPPFMDIKWDDSVYSPNTGSMSVISNNTVITLGNNRGIYNPNSVTRFNVNARDQFPARTFVTSSLFNINRYLPTSSYYSVRDLNTDNIIVDFDSNFTKISTDSNGSFFNLYMNGFEPERYYKILIKVNQNGNVNIYDDNFYFKVTRI